MEEGSIRGRPRGRHTRAFVQTLARLMVGVSACLHAGCGGGAASGGPEVAPTVSAPVPGGGFEGEPIAGALAVNVVDADTGAGVAGAEVRLGPPHDTVPCRATTGVAAAVVFDRSNCFNLQGAQTVTASAYGRAVTTWRGVSTTQLTLPLASRAPSVPALAAVAGSLAGWGTTPPLPGHRQFATLAFSLSDAAAGAEEPLLRAAMATPVCALAAEDHPLGCHWQMRVPVGRRAIAAFLFDVDLRDVADPGDDVTTLTGLALVRGLELAEGAVLDDVPLSAWPQQTWSSLSGDIADAPHGVSRLSAYATLVLPSEGRLRFPEEGLETGAFTLRVPQPTQLPGFADARLDVAFRAAIGTGSAESEIRFPAVDVTSRLTVKGWLAPPSELEGQGRRLSWRAPGAAPQDADLWSSVVVADAAGPAWNFVLLDDQPALALPVLAVDPLSGGSLTLRVTQYSGGRAGASPFALVDAAGSALRAASASAVLQP